MRKAEAKGDGGVTYEVAYFLHDGDATEICADWEQSVADNRPYLEPGDRIRVTDAKGQIIYRERIGKEQTV